jgi:hypothetical protein
MYKDLSNCPLFLEFMSALEAAYSDHGMDTERLDVRQKYRK